MTLDEAILQLEALGDEARRRHNIKNGLGDNQFGCKLGDVRNLAKQIRKDHVLALQLCESGNYEAVILAAMIMEPGLLSREEVEAMIGKQQYPGLVDELIFKTVALTPFAKDLALTWMESEEEMLGRAGWDLWVSIISSKNPGEIDYEHLLEVIENQIPDQPYHKQWAMNHCLVTIALNMSEYTQRCILIGEKIGHFDAKPVSKGCTSSYAPDWIAAVLKRKK